MPISKLVRALGEAMQRWTSSVDPIAVDNVALADSDPIDMRRFSGGWIEVPASLASTTLTWYHARTKGGTYVPVYYGNAAVTTELPGGTACCAEIPAACWDKYFIKALANSDADTVYVGRKS